MFQYQELGRGDVDIAQYREAMPGVEIYPVIIKPSGWQFATPSNLSLVQAARQAAIRLPSSCRNGTCRACMCRLESGQVAYPGGRPGLSPDERDEGWILPCIAHAATPLVIIVPHARPLEKPANPSDVLTGARR